MCKPDDLAKKVKFKYLFAETYNPLYVTGAWGGPTSGGDIVVNFFLERHGLPVSQTFALDDNGKLGKEVEHEPEDHTMTLVRYVETGVVLNLENARRIAKWLGEKVEEAERMREAKKGQTSTETKEGA